MAVTYKDIDQLSQKPTVAGTEKIPVSDTQYITPNQIAQSSGVSTGDATHVCDFEISDDSNNAIVAFSEGHVKTKNFDSSIVPKYVLLESQAAYDALLIKDEGTLYLIPKN